MFSHQDALRVQKLVFDQVGFSFEGPILTREGKGLQVTVADGKAQIAAESLPALARGFFRMAQEMSQGKTQLNIKEEKQFDSCGVFLDFSRNGIMTVAALCRYMDAMAALGMNLMVLYTEDTYTVPEYPYMGYLRGRYTPQELQELDAYAQSLGIELVPCIQTLGHLANFLQWKANQHLKDQPAVLLADEEETYAFIEAQIRALRGSLSGKRLHIGMDEAHGVGLGRYYLKHGPQDRFQLLSRHLDRVVAICRKYGFEPMMWSDMFFRLGSKNNEYYDLEADIPQSVIDALPPVDLVYWDYYHTDEFWYEHMLTQHEKMSSRTIFAGGIWTWSGFLPHVSYSYATMEPALKVCAQHKVKTVMCTLWGDDGQETVHSLCLNQLPLFSEACWRPQEMTRELCQATGEFLTGLDREAYEAFSLFYPCADDLRPGKALIYCDLLYPLGPGQEELDGCLERSRKALAILEPFDDLRCRYAKALFTVCEKKAALIKQIRARYLAKDRAWMLETAQSRIPDLDKAIKALRDLHRQMWEKEFKRAGWEVMALRYGSVLGRLEDVQFSLNRWVRGELESLLELEEEPLPNERKSGNQFYSVYVTPVYNL